MWFLLSAHLIRTGGKEAHQLAGTQGGSICFVRVSNPWRCGTAPPRQHNGNCFHKKDGGQPLPISVQGEPSVVVPSHQEERHHFLPSVDFYIGEHRGRFPQQTQTAEVGLQTSLVRVLEDLPQISSNQIPRYMTWEQDSRVMAINVLDYYWDLETWLLPLVPLIPLALEGVLEQQIEVILICPGGKEQGGGLS